MAIVLNYLPAKKRDKKKTKQKRKSKKTKQQEKIIIKERRWGKEGSIQRFFRKPILRKKPQSITYSSRWVISSGEAPRTQREKIGERFTIEAG